jgi:Retrotransposon gag protein
MLSSAGRFPKHCPEWLSAVTAASLPNSISSFEELSDAFINQFISGGIHEKSSASLMNVVQGKNESLRDYIKRFTDETLGITDLENKIAMVALQSGTTNLYFKMSLAKHPPEDMAELQLRARKYNKIV